jgi:hypothetical protein
MGSAPEPLALLAARAAADGAVAAVVRLEALPGFRIEESSGFPVVAGALAFAVGTGTVGGAAEAPRARVGAVAAARGTVAVALVAAAAEGSAMVGSVKLAPSKLLRSDGAGGTWLFCRDRFKGACGLC